jgi:hypothetical protein
VRVVLFVYFAGHLSPRDTHQSCWYPYAQVHTHTSRDYALDFGRRKAAGDVASVRVPAFVKKRRVRAASRAMRALSRLALPNYRESLKILDILTSGRPC